MVIDKIENHKLYKDINEKLNTAFNFILENDLTKMEVGKHDIDGEDLFAIIQEYDTREIADCKLESHFKYIDLQYMIQGSEKMGVCTLTNQVPTKIMEEKDCAYYSEDTSFIKINQGMFTIFFPDDMHMPCVKNDTVSKVRKVVFKIKN